MTATASADNKIKTSTWALYGVALVVFFILKFVSDNHVFGMPGWAWGFFNMAAAILIGGSSTLNPEERGGKLASQAGFVLFLGGVIYFFYSTAVHMGGK